MVRHTAFSNIPLRSCSHTLRPCRSQHPVDQGAWNEKKSGEMRDDSGRPASVEVKFPEERQPVGPARWVGLKALLGGVMESLKSQVAHHGRHRQSCDGEPDNKNSREKPRFHWRSCWISALDLL